MPSRATASLVLVMVHEEHSENVRGLVLDMIENDDLANAVALLSTRHPADQADLVEPLHRLTPLAVVKG